MKWQRSLRLAAVFLAMSGSLLGSETEKRMQVRWGGLKKLAGGKQVALHLADDARVEGRIRKVTINSLVFKVKKSSNAAEYPKGRIEIARENVSRVEVRGLSGIRGQQVGLTIATFAGTLFASVAAVRATGSDSGGTVGEGVIALAIPTAAAVLVYRGLAPKKATIIEILPDSVGEGESKPNKQGPEFKRDGFGKGAGAIHH